MKAKTFERMSQNDLYASRRAARIEHDAAMEVLAKKFAEQDKKREEKRKLRVAKVVREKLLAKLSKLSDDEVIEFNDCLHLMFRVPTLNIR